MTPKPPEETVAELEARLASLKAETRTKTTRLKEREQERAREIRLRLRRARYRVKARERKKETRRQILIGVAVLDEAKKFPKTERWLGRLLARRLTRPGDRALFDLEPLPEND